MSTEIKKYVIRYLKELTGDVVQYMEILTWDFKEAMITFYARSTGKESLTAADHDLFYDVINEMTEKTIVDFLNLIMADYKILEVRYIVDSEVYPG